MDSWFSSAGRLDVLMESLRSTGQVQIKLDLQVPCSGLAPMYAAGVLTGVRVFLRVRVQALGNSTLMSALLERRLSCFDLILIRACD